MHLNIINHHSARPYRFNFLKAMTLVNVDSNIGRVHFDAVVEDVISEIVVNIRINGSCLRLRRFSVGRNEKANRFYINIHVIDDDHTPHVLYVSEPL